MKPITTGPLLKNQHAIQAQDKHYRSDSEMKLITVRAGLVHNQMKHSYSSSDFKELIYIYRFGDL